MLMDYLGTLIRKKGFLNTCYPHGTARGSRPGAPYLCEGVLLAINHSCSLRDNLVIKMYLGSDWRTSEGWHCLYALSLLYSRAPVFLEGEIYMWLMSCFLYMMLWFLHLLPRDVSWLPGFGFGGQVAYIFVSPETVVIRDGTCLQHTADRRPGHASPSCPLAVFLWIRPLCDLHMSGTFDLRDRFQVWHTSSGLCSCSQGM